MRVIELKTVEEQVAGLPPSAPPIKFEDRDLLRQAVNSVGEGGNNYIAMKQAFDLLDKIDAANGRLDLEDGDWEKLRDKLQGMKWALNARAIADLCQRVVDAPHMSATAYAEKYGDKSKTKRERNKTEG